MMKWVASVGAFAMLWMLCSLTIPAETDDVLFVERFDYPDGSLPRYWEVLEGTARVENGRLHILSQRQNPRVLLHRQFEGDISVSMRLMRAPECHWSGMVVKGIYWLTVNRQYGSLMLDRRMGRVPSGVPVEAVGKQLARVGGYSIYLWDAQDFVMRLDCHGTTLRAYLDGKLFIEVEDQQMPRTGAIMLVGGWGTDIYVDDIIVRRFTPNMMPLKPIPPPTPSLREFTASLDRQDAIYYDGESALLTLSWRATSSRPLRLQFQLIDFYEHVVGRVDKVVEQTKGRRVRTSVPFKPPKRGIFKIALTLVGDDKRAIPQGDIISFSVIPKSLSERPPSEASPFGGHPHWEVPEFHYALARKIGMRWARNHDAIQYTWWVNVQPHRNEWRWYDEQIAILKRNKLHLLGEFLSVPDWATSAPADADKRTRRTSPPRDLSDFARYVYETVKHYRNVIKYWEVWNEPHYSGFWRGTPEQYVELVRTAYRAAKRANPECVIIGGGGVALSALDWIERAFKAGLLRYCDALSFHYGLRGTALESDVQRFERRLAKLRALMRKYGAEKPLWNTEASVHTTSFLDQYRIGYSEPDAHYHFREAAYKLVRMFVVNLANGVKKVFYYDVVWPRRARFAEFALRYPVHTRMLEHHGGLKPIGVAYATVADVLESADYNCRVDIATNVHAYLFKRGEENIAVYWGNFGRRWVERELNLPAIARGTLIDVMNNREELRSRDGILTLPLTRAPYFVICTGINADEFVAVWRNAKITAVRH